MTCKYLEVKKEEDYLTTIECKLLGAKYTCIEEENCINYFVKDYCIHCIHYEPKKQVKPKKKEGEE